MISNYLSTIKHYMLFQALKFIGSVLIFYLIFLNLDIQNYATYGIVQSITILLTLLIGFNIKSSFQKVYSKKLISRTSNFVILIILILSILLHHHLLELEYQQDLDHNLYQYRRQNLLLWEHFIRVFS